MSFDLVELLEYVGIHGKWAVVVVCIALFFWLLLSEKKIPKSFRDKLVGRFYQSIYSIHSQKEKEAQKMSAEIDAILENTQEDTDAHNVIVVRYHNGVYDKVGNSLLKFSATNEIAKPGYNQIGDAIVDVPRSLYGSFCDILIKEHKYYVKDKTALEGREKEIAAILNVLGAEKFYAKPLITSSDKEVIGFVCLIYKEPCKVSETKIDIVLQDAAARIVAKLETNLEEK